MNTRQKLRFKANVKDIWGVALFPEVDRLRLTVFVNHLESLAAFSGVSNIEDRI